MREQWTAVRNAAATLTDDARSSVRMANLAIAAASAQTHGLLVLSSAGRWDGSVLRDAVQTLALAPLRVEGGTAREWDSLAKLAEDAASQLAHAGAMDAWVEAAQAADPERKSRGAYATPMALAHRVVKSALAPYRGARKPPSVIDPSAGAGSLLIAALSFLGNGASATELRRIVDSLHGVELDPVARELCCLLLWVAAAPAEPNLSQIAAHIVLDNAITREWAVNDDERFDALVMNPPWESLRHEVAGEDAAHREARLATIARLARRPSEGQGQPDLFLAEQCLPELFSAQGTGDRNLFKAFVELAPHLIRVGGRLGALIPAAFASDLGMAPLRQLYFDHLQLERWTSFENLRRYFPIDGRYKFGILVGTRSSAGTVSMGVRGFAVDAAEVEAEHVVVTRAELTRVGGRSRMIPEIQSRNEVTVLTQVLERGTPLFERGALGIVRYCREVDLTLDRQAGLFWRTEECQPYSRTDDGEFVLSDGRRLVPLMEGRMVGRYDFFKKSWIDGHGRTAKWSLNEDRPLRECIPQYLAPPVEPQFNRVAICDVTAATNTRTVHATWVPPKWRCGNTAPVLQFESERLALAGLAVLNSMIFDWMARRLVAGLHVNKFYLDALVWPQLAPASVEVLASAAAFLRGLNPRLEDLGGETAGREFTPSDRSTERIAAHVRIEQILAAAFGLSQAMLADILANNPADRRGLWRHFAADPEAVVIASSVQAEEGDYAVIGAE